MSMLPPSAKVCTRCGQTTSPRGGQTPRYCAVCGQRLEKPPTHVRHSFAGGTKPVSGKAIAALGLSIVSFVPSCIGLVLAIVAVVLAASAAKDIRRWPDQIDGQGLATTAMALGIIAMALHLFGRFG